MEQNSPRMGNIDLQFERIPAGKCVAITTLLITAPLFGLFLGFSLRGTGHFDSSTAEKTVPQSASMAASLPPR